MCGIFGYIGSEDSTEMCLEGLKSLEYRGYDSAGIAGIANGQIHFWKEPGNLAALMSAVKSAPKTLDVAIGHTRWATHGQATRQNAHPHFDEHGSIAIAHNGIIENHTYLKKQLLAKNVRFDSETDTEVIAQLIADYYQGNILEACSKAFEKMKGFWGIALIHKDHPGKIITSSRENPICIGYDEKKQEVYLSSDINAFSGGSLKVLFLKKDQIAELSKDGVKLFDMSLQSISFEWEDLQLPEQRKLSKDGYEHFMLKEIFEQPFTMAKAFENRISMEFGTAKFELKKLTPQDFLSVRRIIILGCGTSWHAACIAASMLEDKARVPCQAEIASEFRYKNPIVDEDTLVIAISQSGETLDLLSAVREVKAKGAKILAICNVKGSSLTREADDTLYLHAGQEISVCSTKAFTSQLVVLSLFAIFMARLRHMSKEEGQKMLSEIQNLPSIVQQVLSLQEQIKGLASKYYSFEQCCFLGRHYMSVASLEGALKLKEISYINAIGYAAGEMKHGAIALISPSFLTIGMCGNQKTYEKMASNMMEIKARGGPILAFAPQGAEDIADIANDVLYLPKGIADEFSSGPYVVAAQLLSYHIARLRGTNIDMPRNLAKSVTVE